MATNQYSLNSIHHHHNHHSFRRRHSVDAPPSTLFLKPTTNTTSLSHTLSTTTFSLSPSTTSSSSLTTPPSTSQTISFDLLHQHLSSQNFREADEETRRLLIVLAGDAAQKRGYVFFSEAQFIPPQDLITIDTLWRQYSNDKFGYSVQKKIWNKVNKDFTKLFIKLGWMKKLDTEVVQYNYRSFPTEFTWELTEDTPEGHLPLTNALRGTQLLNCILNHPAFESTSEEEVEENESDEDNGSTRIGGLVSKTVNNKVFKTDYSF